jgi:hypothetical protein
MTKPLSSSAQAVLDAFTEDNSLHDWKHNHYNTEALAAALRAAADQLREAYANEEYVDAADDWLDDIAAELEGTNG